MLLFGVFLAWWLTCWLQQFRKYLTYNKDQHELLYAILQDQFREEATIRDLLEQKQEEPRIHRNDFEAAV